jgi:hypothetical protein
MSTSPSTPDPEETKRAWEIHQNADTLLHSRLSAFAIAQSFLVSGHVLSV